MRSRMPDEILTQREMKRVDEQTKNEEAVDAALNWARDAKAGTRLFKLVMQRKAVISLNERGGVTFAPAWARRRVRRLTLEKRT